MNTDELPDLKTGVSGALYKLETHEIIGCAFDVLNGLGHGLNEKCYENSLTVEFKLRQIPFDQQLPPDYEATGWPDPKLQASPPGVGTNSTLNE